MKKTGQAIKLFLVLLLCTTYFLSFSRYGAKAFESINGGSDVYPAGTTIGNLLVEGKTAEEAELKLTKKYADWVKNTTLSLHYKEKKITMNLEDFQFQIDETVNAAVIGKETDLIVSLEKSFLLDELSHISKNLNEKTMDVNRLLNKLTNIASKMENGEITVSLGEFMIEKESVSTKISEVEITTDESPDEIEEIVSKLSRITIPAQTTFSFLDYLKNQELENAPSKTLSLIASGAYQALLPTNFSVIERNIGQELPSYVELGFEAKIDSSNYLDFIFANPNSTDYTLDFQWNGQDLTVRLLGETFLYEYRILTIDEADYEPKTIKQFSPHLTDGQKKLKQPGEKGYIITVYKEIYENGQLLRSEPISEDFYAPVPKIEIHALPVVPLTTDTNETNVNEANPDGEQSSGEPNTDSNSPGLNDQQNQTETDVNEAPDTESPETSSDESLWGKPNEQPK